MRVRAAGLNGADIDAARRPLPGPARRPPDIPGLELAGEVVRARSRARALRARRPRHGDRRRWRPGRARGRPRAPADAGAGLARLAGGGRLPETFTTAHDALFTQCGLLAGERLLVHGGAGGVGTAAIGLGRCGGRARHRDGPRRGAARRVRRARRDRDRPRGLRRARTFDVILELVGAANLAENVQALAPAGGSP